MMGVPVFNRSMLASVKDYDLSTPGKGIETMNDHLWGGNPAAKQLELLNTFNTTSKATNTLKTGRSMLERFDGLIQSHGASWADDAGADGNNAAGTNQSKAAHVACLLKYSS
jgi:hypothetical protein